MISILGKLALTLILVSVLIAFVYAFIKETIDNYKNKKRKL